MDNITQHLPKKLQSRSLLVSEGAGVFLTLATSGDNWAKPVAGSVASFLGSAYLKKSEWFRRQKIHPVKACKVGDNTPVVALEFADNDTVIVRSMSEVELADDYYDQRVVEETKVEYFL